MSERPHYLPGVVSVTELIDSAGYYQYPNGDKDYYYRKGNWLDGFTDKKGKTHDGCITILVKGGKLDANTLALGNMDQIMPWTKDQRTERWIWRVEGFQDWLSQHRVQWIASQVYVYSPWLTVQGTLDHLWLIDDKLSLIETKSGEVLPCTRLQTSGYEQLLRASKPEYAKATIQRAALELLPHKCTLIPHKDYKDHDAFRALANYYNWHGPKSEYRR